MTPAEPLAERMYRVMRRMGAFLRRAFPLALLLCCATLSMLVGYLIARRAPAVPPEDLLEVAVLNVGQGEASFVRTPDGRFIVIGAGPVGQGKRLAAALTAAGAKRIDVLALPYPYAEAIGGASDLLSAIPVGLVIEPPGPIVNHYQQAVRTYCGQHNIPLRDVSAGDRFVVGAAHVSVLAPGVPPVNTSPAAANNALVLRLQWRDTAFLWAGGIGTAGEDALLDRTPDIAANWLRVARCGTNKASSPEFLQEVAPEIAVVSAGANGADPQTLERLQATGAQVFQTGAAKSDPLTFFSDGTRVTYSTAQMGH